MYSIINGALLPAEEAKILITDLALQRGYGVFDFFKIIDFKPQFLSDHLQRFYKSATALRLPVGLSETELAKMIFQLIEKNNLPNSGIKITLTGGYSDDGYSISSPNLLITQTPLQPNKQTAISLVTFGHQRQLPHVKTIDYLQAIYLQPFIKENNADDVLYYHHGEVTECPRSNFFIVTQNDEIITASKNILQGITRKRILALNKFNVKETTVTLDDLKNAKEAFISSTTKNVLPVVSIDGQKIGNAEPGKITLEIYKAITGQ